MRTLTVVPLLVQAIFLCYSDAQSTCADQLSNCQAIIIGLAGACMNAGIQPACIFSCNLCK